MLCLAEATPLPTDFSINSYHYRRWRRSPAKEMKGAVLLQGRV